MAALKEGGAGSNTMLDDFGSGMEVVDLKERVEKLEVELHGERELLREQKVKAEEARAQASSLQSQVGIITICFTFCWDLFGHVFRSARRDERSHQC